MGLNWVLRLKLHLCGTSWSLSVFHATLSAHLRGKSVGGSFCPFVCVVCTLCSGQKKARAGDVPQAKPQGSSLCWNKHCHPIMQNHLQELKFFLTRYIGTSASQSFWLTKRSSSLAHRFLFTSGFSFQNLKCFDLKQKTLNEQFQTQILGADWDRCLKVITILCRCFSTAGCCPCWAPCLRFAYNLPFLHPVFGVFPSSSSSSSSASCPIASPALVPAGGGIAGGSACCWRDAFLPQSLSRFGKTIRSPVMQWLFSLLWKQSNSVRA